MKAALDEVRIAEDGSVDVRIIPLDELRGRPDILVTISPNTPSWQVLKNLYLKSIAQQLGVGCDVTGIVHGGEDIFTFITEDGDYREVRVGTLAPLALCLRRIVEVAATLELAAPNPLAQSSWRRPTGMPPADANAIPHRPLVTCAPRFISGGVNPWTAGGLNTIRSERRRVPNGFLSEPNQLIRSA
jgi:hypothetical protein